MIFLFPGQGAQYLGMGKDLYEAYSSVKELFTAASDISGLDLKKILFSGSEEQLKQTRITQIGITLVNLSAASVLSERGVQAEATAGFSLGEYSALWYAGALSTEQTFQAVVERGRVMDECCAQVDGAMAAVIGLNCDEVAAALEPMQKSGSKIYLANHNAAKQIVIAGSTESIAAADKLLEEAGAMKYVSLKVSGAFHTPLMEPAAKAFEPFLRQLEFSAPKRPFYSNVTGKRLQDDFADFALRQIYSPVLWVDTEEALKNDGYSKALEIGPGTVLTGLWKQFLRKEPCTPLGTLEQIEAFVAE